MFLRLRHVQINKTFFSHKMKLEVRCEMENEKYQWDNIATWKIVNKQTPVANKNKCGSACRISSRSTLQKHGGR